MGAFVLGILFGWLLEWLFFTYWIKGRSSGRFADADCSGVKSKLAEKESEISALKAALQSAKNASENASASVTEKSGSSSDKKSDATTKKPLDSADADNQAKNVAEKKTKKMVKKVASKPKAEKAKKPKAATGATTKKSTISGDDFTKLTGVGPSMSAKLKSIGITTFQKLAEMDDDILREKLVGAGAKLNNNKEAMDSWNEQAALATKGDFDGLKKLQESLKS